MKKQIQLLKALKPYKGGDWTRDNVLFVKECECTHITMGNGCFEVHPCPHPPKFGTPELLLAYLKKSGRTTLRRPTAKEIASQ